VVAGDEFDWHIRVLEKGCSLKTTNTFGQVSDGFLKLSGQLIEGTLYYFSHDGNRFTNGAMQIDSIPSRRVGHFLYLDRADRGEALIGKPISCLRLCTERMTSKGFGGYFERGLILSRLRPGEEIYQRVGFMTLEQPVDAWEAAASEREIIIV
jgi:hypothetical protein